MKLSKMWIPIILNTDSETKHYAYNFRKYKDLILESGIWEPFGGRKSKASVGGQKGTRGEKNQDNMRCKKNKCSYAFWPACFYLE